MSVLEQCAGEVKKLVRPIVALTGELPVSARIDLFMALLTQEICLLPWGERAEALERVIADLPMVMRATERGMQEALAQNARDGL